MQTNYFAYAVPVFLGAMAGEALFTWRRGKSTYAWSDTFANVGSGMGSQLVGLFLAAATLGVYARVYDHRVVDLAPEGLAAWLLALGGVDLAYYWYHRISHEVNFFWITHVVHHQSEEYNLSVALRQSWFAGIYSWIFYLPLALLGVSPGLYALSYSLNLLYQFIIHTRAVKTLGPLEWVLNTPSHHRVHHGSNQCYLDKNYAGVLIVWDRLFGSFTPEDAALEYGLVKPLKSFNPVWANIHPWVELTRTAAALPGLAKIKLWFKNPGWLPGDLTRAEAQARATGRLYQKHVLAASERAITYVALQFLAVLAGTVLVMAQGEALPPAGLALICGGAVASMLTWEGLLSGSVAVRRWEGLRLALVTTGTAAFILTAQLSSWALVGLAGYFLGSCALLLRVA